jgi:hypothetical protein
MKLRRLMANIQKIRMIVAHGRPGTFQLKYAEGMQRRKPIQLKVVNA